MSLLLPSLILLPLLGAVIGTLLPEGKLPRAWAFFVSLVTLALTLALIGSFDFNQKPADVATKETLRQTMQIS